MSNNSHQQPPPPPVTSSPVKTAERSRSFEEFQSRCVSDLNPTKTFESFKKNSFDDLKNNDSASCCFYVPRRYIMAVLLFSICMLMNCQRSCLSVAIVAMSSTTKYWDGDQWIDQVGANLMPQQNFEYSPQIFLTEIISILFQIRRYKHFSVYYNEIAQIFLRITFAKTFGWK
jgi:hypothetical protein